VRFRTSVQMESTVEHGGEKAGALGVLSQGGKFAQSAAVTSEALGMGGSASVGVFRVGTGMRAAAAGAEGVAEIAGVPLFYWATYANRQAAAACDCPQNNVPTLRLVYEESNCRRY
jgi:hypothetical protein